MSLCLSLFPQLSGKLMKKPFGVQQSVADLLPKTNTAKAGDVLMGRRKCFRNYCWLTYRESVARLVCIFVRGGCRQGSHEAKAHYRHMGASAVTLTLAAGQGGQERECVCYCHDVASLYLLWSCCGIEGNHPSSKGRVFG